MHRLCFLQKGDEAQPGDGHRSLHATAQLLWVHISCPHSAGFVPADFCSHPESKTC